MDYCSTCRRNLNGALVCPGCGAYAPDIAPPARRIHGTVATIAAAGEAWRPEEVPASVSYRGIHRSDAARMGSAAFEDTMSDASDTVPGTESVTAVSAESGAESVTAAGTESLSGFEGAVPIGTGQGRAARRRQLARWKKHRRRALAATTIALVGGGLTVAAMPTTRPSAGHTQAASPPDPVTAAPRTTTTDSVSEQPETRVSGDHGSHPSTPTGRHRKITVATPATVRTDRQPAAAAVAQPPATTSATSHSAPASSKVTHVDNAVATDPAPAPVPAAVPDTTAPASTERTGADASAANPPPDTSVAEPAPRKQLCLLVLCVG
ncbi:SCO2400 family protein [Streptomyces sp. NBC_01321]|uniref:SCO2400 family protein n=1 Tax=Streptomyces sp. NBC_01321 TaxID=2903825 RepID=UPI003FA39E01